jgi:tryptophan-rich sensory protein
MKWRWWHAAAFYSGVQIVELVLRVAAQRVSRGGADDTDADRKYYEKLKLPVFAPPGIAFPVAWSINIASTLAGDLHVMNLPAETPGRGAYLRVRGVSWAVYSTFNGAYFGFRSPINAAAVTFGYTGLTLLAFAIATLWLRDRRAAVSLATTLLWLSLACPVAAAQVAWNRDPFWHLGPFAIPPPALLKKSPEDA